MAIINKALIFRNAHSTLRYLQELGIAESYAFNEYFDEVATILGQEIDRVSEMLPLTPGLIVVKLRKVLDEDNCQFLRDLVEDGADVEDTLGHTYGMLLEQGHDPDEVLSELGITEK